MITFILTVAGFAVGLVAGILIAAWRLRGSGSALDAVRAVVKGGGGGGPRIPTK